MDKKNNEIPELKETKSLVPADQKSLDKPENDTKFAHEAAKILVDIVKQNGWARKLGGQSEHLQYEAWQTVGKYYGYTVKTGETEYVVMQAGKDIIEGFKARAIVVNENTGIEVGSAEAYCTRDERNWSNKPPFQLASMAQTRAGSKALRQIFGFVVALAGYNPTPVEEMTGDEFKASEQTVNNNGNRDYTREPYDNGYALQKGIVDPKKCAICSAVGKYHKPGCPNR